MSDYMEDSLVTHIFRTSSWSKPSALAIALLTTNAVDADTGVFTAGTGVEVTDANAYAREQRDPLDANWTASTDGVTDNVAAVSFTPATGSWGSIAATAIVDNTSHNAGEMLFYSVVDTPKTIDNGDTAEFAIGDIVVTFD